MWQTVRAVGSAWTTMCCLGVNAQSELILPDREPWSAREGGGCLEIGHRVLGVSWGELSWSSWTVAKGSKPLEWAKGLSFEGGPRWFRGHGFWGGMRQLDEGMCMWQVSAGWTSWPEVEVHQPWMEGRVSASRDAPWGNLRIEAVWTHGRPRSISATNDVVARAELPWAWAAWWVPNVDGTALGLPALGWSQDGQWALAWNAQARWAQELRFWRPPPGKIHLHWRLPAHVFEIAWKGNLAVSNSSQNPRTFDRGKPSSAPRQAVGCAMRQGQDLPGWRAFWMWQREGKAPKEP